MNKQRFITFFSLLIALIRQNMIIKKIIKYLFTIKVKSMTKNNKEMIIIIIITLNVTY